MTVTNAMFERLTGDWVCCGCGARMIGGKAEWQPGRWVWNSDAYIHNCGDDLYSACKIYIPDESKGRAASEIEPEIVAKLLYIIAQKSNGQFFITAKEWFECPAAADILLTDSPFAAGSRFLDVSRRKEKPNNGNQGG